MSHYRASGSDSVSRVTVFHRPSQPMQQTCKVCGAPDKFNFSVSDDV